MGLKSRVARLKVQAAKITLANQHFVVICKRVGEDEHRAPGVYYDEHGRVPTIVYEGERGPPEELCAQFEPKTGRGPWFIWFGPKVVPPPKSLPEPYPPEGTE